MSFDTFLASSKDVRDFGDWLVILNPISPLGVTTPLRFSRRGTTTGTSAATAGPYTIAAHTPFRRRLAVAPTVSHSLWSRNRIGGESQPAYGSLQLVNQDGGLDQYRPVADGWRWKNTPCQVFFCDTRHQHVASTIGLVFDGLVKDAKIGLGGATVELQGFEGRYGQMTSERVFRGTGYQLELAGDRTVDYGVVTEVDLTGSMSLETWFWIDSGATANVTVWGWNGGTSFPWQLRTNTARNLILRCSIGGSAQLVTTAAALSFFTSYHISIDISGRDVTFYIWNDDAQTLTIETFTNAFTSATRDSHVGGNYQVRSVDATYAIWVDEMRVWDVARTESEHAASRFGEFEDGSVPSDLVHYARMNDGTGTTVTDSAAGGNDGTISGAGSSNWLWAMEGGPELAGTPKCEVWGFKKKVRPILVDPIRQVYFVSPADTENALDDIVATYEGGNPHTMDAEAAGLRALIATVPTAGHSLPYSARGLFRLGSSPTLPISADVDGFGVTAGPGFLADTIEQLVTTRLATTPTLDTASFTALAALNIGRFGVFLERPEPMRQTLDFLLAGVEGWWGHLRGEQDFHVEQFTGPAAIADYNWTERDIVNIEPIDVDTVIYGVEVKFAQNHTVLTEDQVAAAIKGTTDWQQWTQEWQIAKRVDEDIREKFPGDASVLYTVETARYGRANAELFADFLLALLKGAKEAFKVTLKPVGKVVKAGETCTLSLTLQRGRQRLSLDGTKKYVVLDTTEAQQRGETTVTVWGGTT